jgi:hypothetical protein
MGCSRFGMNTLSKWLFSLKNGIFDFHDAPASRFGTKFAYRGVNKKQRVPAKRARNQKR